MQGGGLTPPPLALTAKEAYAQFAESIHRSAIECMSIGVSYNDYWYGKLEIADYAISAYKTRIQSEMNMLDAVAHRVGYYVGITTAIALGGKTQYPEAPLGFRPKDETDGEKTIEQIENEMRAYLA